MKELFFILLVISLLYYIGLACYKYPILKKKIEEDEKRIKEKEDEANIANRRSERMSEIIHSKAPFSLSSSFCSDIDAKVYDISIYSLTHKYRPAFKAADEVGCMRNKTKEYISLYKTMLYKYEFLLNTFPELKKYVDDEEALFGLCDCEDYDDFESNRDKTLDYLSKEEWNKLGVNERNQLALDRYKKKNKSNWVIGIEYEMYIEYLLRKNGFRTISFGSLKGIEDLGRDIVAKKMNAKGEMVTYIIQCKNWSVSKEIHENTVCQLFGTTIEYGIRNKQMFQKTIPVLYTTTKLSDTAMEFAKRLGVMVIVTSKGDYPMIKCNINDGNKIYHLPFDQQYYRTQICKPGEFYAWTVNEAVSAGFRRAFKYKK